MGGSLFWFLFVLAGSSVTAKPTVLFINDVCDKITDYFNILTSIAPISVQLEGNDDESGSLFTGQVSFDSTSRRLTNCSAVSVGTMLAVELSLTDKITVYLPGLNATIENCHVKLHYRVKSSGENITIRVALAEVTKLGDVFLENGTDFTVEAESLIRPLLFDAFNDFTKKHFSFSVNHQDDADNELETLKALQFVLKKSMLHLLNRKSEV